MITVKFYVKSETYQFTAESVWEAMAMCNRQVIDKLDLHPIAWADAGKNEFVCHPGNFFD
jgi:hypothetical protein